MIILRDWYRFQYQIVREYIFTFFTDWVKFKSALFYHLFLFKSVVYTVIFTLKSLIQVKYNSVFNL